MEQKDGNSSKKRYKRNGNFLNQNKAIFPKKRRKRAIFHIYFKNCHDLEYPCKLPVQDAQNRKNNYERTDIDREIKMLQY
jgi:hypothetical protein